MKREKAGWPSCVCVHCNLQLTSTLAKQLYMLRQSYHVINASLPSVSRKL